MSAPSSPTDSGIDTCEAWDDFQCDWDLGNYVGISQLPLGRRQDEQYEWLLHGSGKKGKSARYDCQHGCVSVDPKAFTKTKCSIGKKVILEGESGAHNLFIVGNDTHVMLDVDHRGA